MNVVSESRYLSYYIILTLVIGGLAFTPWVLASYGQFPAELVAVPMLIGGLSPTIAAFIASYLEYGRRGPARLFGQFGRRFPARWILVPFLLPLAVSASAVLLWQAFGGVYILSLLSLASFLPVFVTALVQNVWEGVGWRGYALPKLQSRYGALISSVIIGVFWTLWH